MCCLDRISDGPTASVVNFVFGLFFLKMEVSNCKGHLLFADAAKLEPGRDDLAGLFGRKTIWSMIYVITPDFEGIHKLINAAIEEDQSMLAGSSILPHDCGLVIRMLDDSIAKISHLTDTTGKILRNDMLFV